MHDIKVLDDIGETKTVRIKSVEHIVHEWINSVVMLTHKPSGLKLAAVILDARNHTTALFEVSPNQKNSRRANDFFIEIYGVSSTGRVVTYHNKSLDPNKQNETIDPAEGMTHLELSRKHISNAKYEVRFRSSGGTKLIFLTEIETDEKHFFQCASGTTKYEIPFSLNPTKEYEISVFFGSCDGPGRFSLSEHGSIKFQAAMSKGHLSLLHKRAIESCNDRSLHHRINFLYRNKPKQYFDKILSQNGGIMTKYMKNDGGDQASPLNRAIQGLFFSAYFWTNSYGQLIEPPTSPFGNQRFHVAVSFFLNSNNNLYFADFYCHYTNHHVTLVVTEANSESDKFCKENLIFLESFNNPFLYYNRLKHCFFLNTSVNVEVFYTENINIGRLLSWGRNYASLTLCKSVGDSKTKSFIGQSKNINCDICNLNTL